MASIASSEFSLREPDCSPPTGNINLLNQDTPITAYVHRRSPISPWERIKVVRGIPRDCGKLASSFRSSHFLAGQRFG
jgi:hypothetical protein